ncbi:Long tail fiber protein p37 [Burkholderia singularis]|uniref:Long tail fiber protein p37 n=2 Tax=Burkholderia singularis TaxID=1503053 RepID=A0A238H505_9BURK|nr:Long tail fiber protein p37 [Burkholderia singularis]
MNHNVDILSAQLPLTSALPITEPWTALTPVHIGKRVNINFPVGLSNTPGIKMPVAAQCPADGVVLLRNIGPTACYLQIADGSGDAIGLSRLNSGESAFMDTDGVHAWNVAMRGRTSWLDEYVQGDLYVGRDRAEAHLAVGDTDGYFYAGAAGAGWWSKKYGAFQYVVSDKTFRINGLPVVTSADGHTVRFDWAKNVAGQLGITVDSTVIGYAWHSGNLTPLDLNSGGKVRGELLVSTYIKNDTLTRSSGIGAAIKGAINPRGLEASVQLWMESQPTISYGILAVDGWQPTRYFRFEESGNALAPGAWTNYSDRRLKRDIEPIRDALQKLGQLTGCTFEKFGKRQAGLIAQDMLNVLPEGVINTGTFKADDGEEVKDCLSVYPDAAVALLVQAVNELTARVNRLESVDIDKKEIEPSVRK